TPHTQPPLDCCASHYRATATGESSTPDGRKVTVSGTVASRPAAWPKEEVTPEPVCTGQNRAVLSSRRGRGPPPSPHAGALPPVPVLGGQGSNPPSTYTWGVRGTSCVTSGRGSTLPPTAVGSIGSPRLAGGSVIVDAYSHVCP